MGYRYAVIGSGRQGTSAAYDLAPIILSMQAGLPVETLASTIMPL